MRTNIEDLSRLLGRSDIATTLQYLLDRAVEYAGPQAKTRRDALAACVVNGEYLPLHLPAYLVRAVAETAADRAARYAMHLYNGAPVQIRNNAAAHAQALQDAIDALLALTETSHKPLDPFDVLVNIFRKGSKTDLDGAEIDERVHLLFAAAISDKAQCENALAAFEWMYGFPFEDWEGAYRQATEILRDRFEGSSQLATKALMELRSAIERTLNSGNLDEAARIDRCADALKIVVDTWGIVPPVENGIDLGDMLRAAGCSDEQVKNMTSYVSIAAGLHRARSAVQQSSETYDRYFEMMLTSLHDFVQSHGHVEGTDSSPYFETAAQTLRRFGFEDLAALICEMEDAPRDRRFGKRNSRRHDTNRNLFGICQGNRRPC